MTFNPSQGIPNSNPAGPDPTQLDAVELASTVHTGDTDGWQPTLFPMAQPRPTTIPSLGGVPISRPRGWEQWMKIYDVNKGMTKGESAAIFKRAKATLSTVEMAIAAWAPTNNDQSGIKTQVMGFLAFALSNCRSFSPASLKSAMANMIYSLPQPYSGVLAAVFGGTSPGDKAGRFIQAIKRIQRFQPGEEEAERRLRIALKTYSSGNIRSFLASNPLVSTNRALMIASEIAYDSAEDKDIRYKAFKLLKTFGFPVDDDKLNTLIDSMPKRRQKPSPWENPGQHFRHT